MVSIIAVGKTNVPFMGNTDISKSLSILNWNEESKFPTSSWNRTFWNVSSWECQSGNTSEVQKKWHDSTFSFRFYWAEKIKMSQNQQFFNGKFQFWQNENEKFLVAVFSASLWINIFRWGQLSLSCGSLGPQSPESLEEYSSISSITPWTRLESPRAPVSKVGSYLTPFRPLVIFCGLIIELNVLGLIHYCSVVYSYQLDWYQVAVEQK